MRVHQIALYSNDLQVIKFDLTGPDVRNPYTIKAITGLDAEEIIPRYYSSGIVTRNAFTELSLAPREITLRIDLKPNYRQGQHPSDLRSTLMKTISSSRDGRVQLRFYEDGVCWGAIKGFITKFEAPVTSKDTEVQFTIKCDDPIIRSLTVTSQVIFGLDYDPYTTIFDPISTSPHGFKMKISLTGSLPGGLSISDPDDDWEFVLDYGFLTGDELYISSEFGDKYLYVVSSAVTTNLMDVLTQDSLWPMIFPGENRYVFSDYEDINIDEWFWYETHWGI